MNKTAKIFRIARISLAPLAAIFLIPQLHAQDIQTRFLLIFDTSQDMKSRLKDEQLEINQLLATSMAGQLHDGDSIGVWTFDQALQRRPVSVGDLGARKRAPGRGKSQ